MNQIHWNSESIINTLTPSWTHKSSLAKTFISKLEGIVDKIPMSAESMSQLRIGAYP